MVNHRRVLNPLKILIVADRNETLNNARDQGVIPAIRRMFQGGVVDSPDRLESYFAAGSELGVDIRELYWSKADTQSSNRSDSVPWRSDVKEILETCNSLLIVVLLDRTYPESDEFKGWLNSVSKLAVKDPTFDNKIGVLPVSMTSETVASPLRFFDEFQRVPISELGEHSSRSSYLAVLAIARAWSLLSGDPEKRIKLFISHAKMDGLPVALSIKAQLDSLRWLSNFYDARDILPGSQWRKVLERNVQESAIIILRTETYEQRPWCLQEVDWADQFGAPAVVVDLRSRTLFPREVLPIADMTTVRIPDGNLMRILNATMREAMRVKMFQVSVQLLIEQDACKEDQIVICPRTSLTTLGLACQHSTKDRGTVRKVVVPEAFRESKRDIAERIVDSYFPNAQLCKPKDLAII